LQAAEQADKIVAAVYVIPSAGRKTNGNSSGSIGLSEGSGGLLSSLLKQSGSKAMVLAMGNPYVASDFPDIQNYLCTFSNSTVSEMSAVKALFGEITIRGRLPVTIPNIAQRGAGIDRAATAKP